jgi:ribonuclease J
MADPVKLVFLGGLGEIGRNCAAVEIGNRIMLVDVGLMFPESDMFGVDLVLPDFTYLRQNADRIEGAILTHGHEDHMGALAYLLRDVSFPIYSSRLTLGLARNRIEEAGLLDRTDLIPVEDNERRQIGPFDVEFIPVTHSVPHAFAIAFHSPQGVIVHTGDFKLDLTPIDSRRTEIARIGALAGGEGMRLLLSDSTNAEEPGFTPSESSVGDVLRDTFTHHPRQRFIVACFASHIHRIQQVADAAIAAGRKIATLGRSMGKNVALAREMGLLTIPESALIPIEAAKDHQDAKICILSTGSQGEPMSALALMAAGQSKWLDVGANDVVILSSHPIPGNETSVGRVIDGLYRRGAEVIHSGLARVHASGHARQQELKTMLSAAKPQFFIPVHGEFRHLTHHARIAMEMGVKTDNVLLAEDGDVVVVDDTGVYFDGTVPADYMYVDGITADVGPSVLRDREVLAKEGVVMVVVTVDRSAGKIVSGPDLITRGWVYAPESQELLDEGAAVVKAKLSQLTSDELKEIDVIRRTARKAAGSFVAERTQRRPMIVPVIMEVSG